MACSAARPILPYPKIATFIYYSLLTILYSLFDRDGFGEVPRLIDIAAFDDGDMVG